MQAVFVVLASAAAPLRLLLCSSSLLCGRRCGRHHKMQRSSFAFFSSSLSFLEFVVVCLHLRLPVLVLVVCLLVVRSPACSLCQTMSQVNLEAKVVLVGSQRECAGAHPWCLDEVGRNDSSSMGGGEDKRENTHAQARVPFVQGSARHRWWCDMSGTSLVERHLRLLAPRSSATNCKSI